MGGGGGRACVTIKTTEDLTCSKDMMQTKCWPGHTQVAGVYGHCPHPWPLDYGHFSSVVNWSFCSLLWIRFFSSLFFLLSFWPVFLFTLFSHNSCMVSLSASLLLCGCLFWSLSAQWFRQVTFILVFLATVSGLFFFLSTIVGHSFLSGHWAWSLLLATLSFWSLFLVTVLS